MPMRHHKMGERNEQRHSRPRILPFVTAITAAVACNGLLCFLEMSRRKKFGLLTAAIAAVPTGLAIYASVQMHATAIERAQHLAGDELITSPIGVVNRAITIHRPNQDVWPWLAQMGSGRAGWYSYDFIIDNGGRRSADRIPA